MSKRIRYFFGHLSASFCFAIILTLVVFFIWYPTPLASAEGVIYIFYMILFVDIIIGPLLGLLIYKEGKKNLKNDLLIIIILQLVAVFYGVYSIAQSRPVWIAQNGAIFQLVRANAILPEDQDKASTEFRYNHWWKPNWVAVNQRHPQYEFYAEPTLVPNLYEDLSHAMPRISRYAQPISRLALFNSQHQINEKLKKYPQVSSWMPLRTTGSDLVVLFDKKMQIINVVDLRPWSE